MKAICTNPIFVGGYFKSGTSLLRALLGQHPDVASGLETHWFAIDPRGGTGRHDEPLGQTIDRLAAFFDLDAAAISAATAQTSTGEAFLDALMQLHLEAQGKTRWAEKTPDNILHVDRVFDHWPDARFLHILRDPRDVYVSLANCGKGGAPDDFAASWSTWIAKGEAAAQAHGSGRFRTVLYADLVNRPETVMRGLSGFLGLGWDPALASFEGRRDEYELVLRTTGKRSTTLESLSRPLFNDRVGVWRRDLPPDLARALVVALERSGGWAAYRRLCDAWSVDGLSEAG
ncbi:MAG: sulfotransferase [Alphaproteobacteria bacterium]|nr:sulfotransferase [Alphaproteobacteria bacterium]